MISLAMLALALANIDITQLPPAQLQISVCPAKQPAMVMVVVQQKQA
jgi:hypothetical protein